MFEMSDIIEIIERAWEFFKISWSALFSDFEMLLFPLTSIIMGSIILFIAFPIFNYFKEMSSKGTFDPTLFVFFLFLIYLMLAFINNFFEAALVGAAFIRFEGGNPGLRDGIRIAANRIDKIFAYSAITATIGVILSFIRERGKLGRFISSILGRTWRIIVFFVLPIIIVENLGPLEAIKKSKKLFRKTAEVRFVVFIGIEILFFLIRILLSFLFLVLVFKLLIKDVVASKQHTASSTITSSPYFVILLIAYILINIFISALRSAFYGMFKATLYKYAAEGVIVDVFYDPYYIQNAFLIENKGY